MDKQQEQTKQNPNQEVEYISGFLDEDEVVNESEFEEQPGEQEAGTLADNQQKKPEEEQPKKIKRPRKTIEQEIAELDAKRERLMEKKRRQEAHEKIIFGATVLAMLKDMKIANDINYQYLCKRVIDYINNKNLKNKDCIIKIINNI